MNVTPNLKDFSYDKTNLVNGYEPIPPIPPPDPISVSPINDPSIHGEYAYYAPGNNWLLGRDGNVQLKYNNILGYWVITYYGSPAMKNTAPEDTQPPKTGWIVDPLGSATEGGLPMQVAYGTPYPAFQQWVVQNAGTPAANDPAYDAVGYRCGFVMFKHPSNANHIWYDWEYGNWTIGPLDDSANALYYNDQGVYLQYPPDLSWQIANPAVGFAPPPDTLPVF
jgi:hypothetical protein